CPLRAYGAGMLARTRQMKATNSSSEWKCVICPETTCSTRPSQTNGAPGGWVRNCTTNARLVGSGSGSGGIGDLLQRPVGEGMYTLSAACQEGNMRTYLRETSSSLLRSPKCTSICTPIEGPALLPLRGKARA